MQNASAITDRNPARGRDVMRRLTRSANQLEKRQEMLIKVNAQNDVNGNPRRRWIHLSDEGRFLGFYDEGYDDGGDEVFEL